MLERESSVAGASHEAYVTYIHEHGDVRPETRTAVLWGELARRWFLLDPLDPEPRAR